MAVGPTTAAPAGGVDDPPHGADRPELQRFLHVARDVVLFRVVFLVIGWLARWGASTDTVRPDFGLDHWLQWDAHHLLAIADIGYADSVADGNSAGFLFGFPLAVRVVAALPGVDLLVAGMLVSFLGTLVAAYHLHRLAESHGWSGDRAVLALLLFPTSVFLVAPYSEALFLAVAIGAFLHAREDRPWAVAPFALLCTFIRPVGPFVVIGVVVELVRRRWARRSVRALLPVGAVVIAGLVPVVGHGLAFAEREGTIFAYARAQSRVAGRELASPIDGFLTTADTWWSGASSNHLVTWQLELVSAALTVLLLAWLLGRREWGYACFVAGTLVVTVATPYWLSGPRVALSLFPFMLYISAKSADADVALRVFAVMGSGAMVGVFLFVQGYWFF